MADSKETTEGQAIPYRIYIDLSDDDDFAAKKTTKKAAPAAVAASTDSKKTTKKAATAAGSAPKQPKNHPPVKKMILEAVEANQGGRGCSMEAIKKHMESQHHVDVKKLKPHIKKAIEKCIEEKDLKRVGKGKGLSGSFKIKNN